MNVTYVTECSGFLDSNKIVYGALGFGLNQEYEGLLKSDIFSVYLGN